MIVTYATGLAEAGSDPETELAAGDVVDAIAKCYPMSSTQKQIDQVMKSGVKLECGPMGSGSHLPLDRYLCPLAASIAMCVSGLSFCDRLWCRSQGCSFAGGLRYWYCGDALRPRGIQHGRGLKTP